jgi:hypothetical protein
VIGRDRGRKDIMSEDPVRPLHVHEPAPVERPWLNSAGYFVVMAAVGAVVVAALFGLR